MAALEACSVVDAIDAFLEYLVDPLLQEEHYVSEDPPLSLQEKVAKQVHSVVLLYNYYYRKQNPDLEFLRYREFCKMIVDLRPTLLPYMKFTSKPYYDAGELIDLDEQLSLTEKEIMNSYHICTDLDASKIVPDITRWPISKVAILLVDRKKENCFLCFSSITEGVWSLIEKQVDTINQSEKRRVIKKRSKDGLNEDQILQVGYSAVKEVAGLDAIDTILLESYNVYSHSKDRTTSRLYIMKCSELINEGFFQHPIKDLMESVRGPLLERSSNGWKVTPQVKYFHMLPYSEIISREIFSNRAPMALKVYSRRKYKRERHYGGDVGSSHSYGAPNTFKVYSRRKYNKRGGSYGGDVGSSHSNGASKAFKVYSRRKYNKREGNYGGDIGSSHSNGASNAFKLYSRRNKKIDR